jgi:hypothetical protein
MPRVRLSMEISCQGVPAIMRGGGEAASRVQRPMSGDGRTEAV